MKRLLVIALLWCEFAVANDGDAAQNAYQAKQWKNAATLYGQLTEAEPNNALYWYRLGTSLRMSGDLSKAEAALLHAQQLGFQPMMINIGLAGVAAQSGDSERALNVIEGLAKNGAPAAAIIENDPAFVLLRSQARFAAALESMKEQAAPCKYPEKNPQYRQFDFWVGEWDVYGKAGALVGHSHVDLILGNCVVSENWTDMTGGEGKSYNKYNAPLKRWEQYWVDQYGQTTFYTGNLEGPNMVFMADGFDPTGKPQKQRLTFFPMGSDKVRQFGESSDDGKTWNVSYDLTYVRRKSSSDTTGK